MSSKVREKFEKQKFENWDPKVIFPMPPASYPLPPLPTNKLRSLKLEEEDSQSKNEATANRLNL